jgi:hypothetical protein
MKTIATVIVAAGLSLGGVGPSAASSFSYVLDASAAYLLEAAYTGSKPQVHPGEPIAWNGTLTFETSSAADGTYLTPLVPDMGRVTSFVLSTNLISYDLKSGISNVQIPPYVILKDGKVADLGFRVEPLPDIWVRISGMNVTYSSTLYDGFHAGGTGTLVATPIPEPETYALMLAGIAAIAGQVRRRRS